MPYKTGSWGKQAKERSLRRKEYFRRYSNKLRQRILKKLGGKCSRCGYSDFRALQIDHKDGDGADERRNRFSKNAFYKKVLKDTKGKYQLLCSNCNWIKRFEMNEFGNHTKPRKVIELKKGE